MKHNLLFLSIIVLAFGITSCQSSKKSAETGHAPLIGTQWTITAIQGQAVPEDVDEKPYIVFDTNGNYHGSLSCNSFFGEYTVKKSKIKLSYAGATKKLCRDMTTEDALLKALKAEIDSYEFKNDVLYLYADKTEILKLEK